MNYLFRALGMSCMLLSGMFMQGITVGEKNVPIIKMEKGSYETETNVDTKSKPRELSCAVENENHIDSSFTKEEIELIALVTMAEAEGESEYGKRLVIDTVLNRVASDKFPNTVNEVIYQPYHFESVWNGRIDVCYVDDNICNLVYEEIENTTDKYTYYFCAGDYSQYGTPMYQVDNHYFSTY